MVVQNYTCKLVITTIVAGLTVACNNTNKFGGGTRMAARDQKVISADRVVETSKKSNIWIVSRLNAQKSWTGLLTQHDSNTITVGDVTNLRTGMWVSGPGLDSACEDMDAATAGVQCPGRGAIANIDSSTKTLTLTRKIRHTSLAASTGNYVVHTGVANWLQVEGDKIIQHKKWSGLEGNGDYGIRTYVTEGGFLAARFPFVYFIDPDSTPEGLLPETNIKNFDPTRKYNGASRICLGSYIKDDKRFMIAAFGAGKYYEIPMADTKPYRPLWDDLNLIPLREINNARGNEKHWKAQNPPQEGYGWGYSCHMNQKKKIFYSQWFQYGAKTLQDNADPSSSYGGAVDLTTYKTVDLDSQIPNAKFIQNNPVLKSFALSTGSAMVSYAVGGDPDGNIYNADVSAILPPEAGSAAGEGNNTYTMAYEKISDTIWISRNTDKITVVKRKCLTTEPNCTSTDYFVAKILPVASDPASCVTIGPLSALKDGRVVGLSRCGGGSWVRIFSLKDPADISKGVDALPLVKIPGDPYMYVDFTGATLYTRESEQTFKITDLADYAKRAPKDARPDKILEAHFEWKNASATPPEWVGMRLEARCYADSSNKGAYEEIKTVANAGVKNLLNLPSCKNQFIEAIDIKITQVKGESLGDVESLKIHVKQ
jgi:hypothetical protein